MPPRNSPRTHQLSGTRYRAYFVEGVSPTLVERWLSEPESLIGAGAGSERTRRSSHRSTADLFIKRHRRNRWKATFDTILRRPSPALRAFCLGLRLRERGVTAVRPLAAIERRRAGESFLVLEKVNADDLREYLLDRMGDTPTAQALSALKADLWRELGEAVAGLHASGVRQRDLKAPNILIACGPSGGHQVTFVDLEGMTNLRRSPRRSVRARDLARLGVSLRVTDLRDAGIEPEDWRVLVGHYLGAARRREPGLALPSLPWWLEKTERWAKWKEERNLRRGRGIR